MDKIKELFNKVKEFITDYPVQFLMIGCFIVGFILGAIIF